MKPLRTYKPIHRGVPLQSICLAFSEFLRSSTDNFKDRSITASDYSKLMEAYINFMGQNGIYKDSVALRAMLKHNALIPRHWYIVGDSL